MGSGDRVPQETANHISRLPRQRLAAIPSVLLILPLPAAVCDRQEQSAA